MVHIILLILKIIGYILLGLLGIVLLVVAIILFAPIKYQIEGRISNSIDSIYSSGRITWLFRLIHIKYHYEKGDFLWNGRVAWIRLDEEEEESIEEVSNKIKKTRSKSKKTNTSKEEKKAQNSDIEDVCFPEVWEEIERPRKIKSCTQDDEDVQLENTSFLKRLMDKCKTQYHKMITILKKIKYTFRRFCDTINNIWKQKEVVEQFISDKIHKYAFTMCKDQLLYLWKHVRPKRMKVCGEFGFEDPSMTGKSLAVMSMFQMFYGDEIQIKPNFEEQIYVGNILIKGKIRVIYFVIVAFRLFKDKKVRLTYKHLKKLNFSNNDNV